LGKNHQSFVPLHAPVWASELNQLRQRSTQAKRVAENFCGSTALKTLKEISIPMNKRNIVCFFAVLAALTCAAFAQDTNSGPRPKFGHLPPHAATYAQDPASTLATFKHTYDFVGDGGNISITQVGSDPSSTNTTTTVPIEIIPIKMVFTVNGKTTTFDPATKLSNGRTVIQNTSLSPLFQGKITYTQGGTNLGTTQYEDAWARGDFWTNVMTNTSWHVLLGTPKILGEQTITVPTSEGTVTNNPFGSGTVGIANINWFDSQIQTLLKKAAKQITPNTFPIFELYDVYLSENSGISGCCIGGYHDATGTQTYTEFDYEDSVGSFSQDVSALSHETGEWYADPFVNNPGCGGLLEVGDPLEGEANYGGYPYTLNGFTYNLQDLVFLKYFGQSPATSVNGWETFQGTTLSTCQNGQ
jgi:hypothetical protein